jgi:hypothetical protein
VAASRSALRKVLGWYAFGLASVVCLSAGLLLTLEDHTLTGATVASAIGVNLIASVAFAVVFSTLSNRIQERGLRETVSEQIGELSRTLFQEMAESNQAYLPLATYPPLDPLDGYGDQFNTDMTHSLESTGFYAFRGPSPRYVAARLRCSRRPPQQVRVVSMSPGDRRAIARRASDRRQWARQRGKDLPTLQRELREELVRNVVALFDYRHVCPVELAYIEDTAVYRFEMFDDSMYLSWFHGPQSAAHEMPESFRFGAESVVYRIMRQDLLRKFEIAPVSVRFTIDQDDDFLARHLEQLLAEPVTAADLRRWREEYDGYVADFVDYIQGLYRRLRRSS